MTMSLSLLRRLRGLLHDTKGVSAVEFALVLPLMMTLYLGGVEVSQAISASRKVTMVSRAVADLASQSATINNASMTNILNASSAVVSPFASAKLKVTVSQIKIDANKNATIEWSDTFHGTARGAGSSATVPAGLLVPNTYLIWSEVEYEYEPTIGYVITGDLNLHDQMYMRPRLANNVQRTS